MTDLERARVHLLWCQEALYFWRTTGREVAIKRREESFLAALRAVAYEQEKEAFAEEMGCDPSLYETQWPAQ